MTAIIILNWNGYIDTIQCLESLYKDNKGFYTIVVDNGSSDDSLSRIFNWCSDNNINIVALKQGEALKNKPCERDCVFVAMNENLGFARANNYALELIKNVMSEYVMLLNNDTVVTEGFLDSLVQFASVHSQYVVFTPQIRYYGNKDIVWNCGGKLLWGTRKYYYPDKNYKSLPDADSLDVSFVTGCALLFRPVILDDTNHLFTEDFFFGEEDYNLCIKLRKQKYRAVCVLNSLIYHKVNASITKVCDVGRIYIATLNRAIDMRIMFGELQCFLWLSLFTIYTSSWMMMGGISLKKTYRMFAKAWKTVASGKSSVNKDDFEDAIKYNF